MFSLIYLLINLLNDSLLIVWLPNCLNAVAVIRGLHFEDDVYEYQNNLSESDTDLCQADMS